jgi:hypothetical protein
MKYRRGIKESDPQGTFPKIRGYYSVAVINDRSLPVISSPFTEME